MKKIKMGFCITGSFCTFSEIIEQIRILQESGKYEITPIMSQNAFEIDTRFGKSSEINAEIENICGKKIIHTIASAEPIGPQKLLDVLVIAPCTGNTLAKLANGIADTAVTLAAKAHLRNNRPVIVAISTNDALSGNAKNIGMIQNIKNYYFVPYRQDDSEKKPMSMVADFSKIDISVEFALQKKQAQPLILG